MLRYRNNEFVWRDSMYMRPHVKISDNTIYYVIHKKDDKGFKYADVHTHWKAVNSKTKDSYGNILKVLKVDQFLDKDDANEAMKQLRIVFNAFNIARDPAFVQRGDRTSNKYPDKTARDAKRGD